MGDELGEALKQSLEELVAAEDVAAAIEKVKQTYDWVGSAISDVHRFIGENAARLAASTLARYDREVAGKIAMRLRPGEKTTDEQKANILSTFDFLRHAELTDIVNSFPKDYDLPVPEDDPVLNLVDYAGSNQQEFRQAIMQLATVYQQNPEVVMEVLSTRTSVLPELVEVLSAKEVLQAIRAHPGKETRHKLVSRIKDEVTAKPSPDFFGIRAIEEVLGKIDPNYFPKPLAKEQVDVLELLNELNSLSRFLMERVEPKLAAYKGHEREFTDLAYKLYQDGRSYRVSSYASAYDCAVVSNPLDTFAKIIDLSPTQDIGFAIAKKSLNIWEKSRMERRDRIQSLLKALESSAFKEALLKAKAMPVSHVALKGLTYTAHKPDLTITENVSQMLATSTYSNFLELESFFNLVRDEGRYFKQVHQLARTEAPLAEKTAALRLFAQLKKAGVGAGDPSTDVQWKEDAAKIARQFLFSRTAKLHASGGRVDAESQADIEAMSLDQLVDFLNVRRKDGDAEQSNFPGHEFFLTYLPEYRARKSKYWHLGKDYGSLANLNGAEFSPTQLAELLVSGLIGRIPERVESARKVFGQNLDLARSYVLAQVTSKKAYHAVKRHLIEVQRGAVEAVEPVLAYFTDMIKNETLEGNVNRKKIEALSDVIEDVKGVAMETTPIKLLTARLQQVVPSDLFDSRTLHCCTFYPSGVRRNENMRYFYDPNVVLLYFLSGQESKPEKRGVAIIFRTTLEDRSTALVVDSVEGSPLIRRINGWEDFVLGSIRALAADARVDKILVNERVAGNTPKNFVAGVASQVGVKKGFFAFNGISPTYDGLEGIGYKDRKSGVEGYELSLAPMTVQA